MAMCQQINQTIITIDPLLRIVIMESLGVEQLMGMAGSGDYRARSYMEVQGRPEKLRGPGQRVKVGPLTQVVR